MSFTIEIVNEDQYTIDRERLQQAAAAVLERHEVAENSEMSVAVTSNEAVHALNKQHRGVDSPTDVLSFPADPLPPAVQATGAEAPYLGDVVIAHDYALEQALREKHDFGDSLALLVVHGTLHLLGYDHDTPENRAEMWEQQSAVLEKLGIDEAIVPTLENGDHV